MNTLVTEQLIKADLKEVWDFFCSPKNLNLITPPDMAFEILSEIPDKMHEGMLIHYRIRPFLNLPLKWVTEITEIKEPFYFVDEQRKGPYALWRHEHHFEKTPEGILMKDILNYDTGKFFFGKLAELLFVRKKVNAVFEYRRRKIEEIFNSF